MANRLPSKLSEREKWGRLTPVEFVGEKTFPSGQRQPFGRFRCDCGSETVASAYSVISGKTQSCGCAARLKARTRSLSHGHASARKFSPEYRTWRNMLTRGRNPNICHAHHYSVRGITVHPDWLPGGDRQGFARFLAHIGPRPEWATSIDRIDNSKGYEPGNVRWADQKMQANNQRRNVMVVYAGKSVTIAQAAEMAGMNPAVIRDRMRLGWPEDRLFAPRARSEFGKGPCSRPGVKPRN